MKTTLIESYMNICKYEVRCRGQAGEGSSVEFINKWKDPEYSSSPGSKSVMAIKSATLAFKTLQTQRLW